MKKLIYAVDCFWEIVTRLLMIGFAVAILLCVKFLHFDFLSSWLWWTFFDFIAVAWVIEIVGRMGRDYLSSKFVTVSDTAILVIILLSFIFFWWEGGLGIFIGSIILGILFVGLLGLLGSFYNISRIILRTTLKNNQDAGSDTVSSQLTSWPIKAK